MYEDYKKQYASDSFDNSAIETGDALINNTEEEMGGDNPNNQYDPQQL